MNAYRKQLAKKALIGKISIDAFFLKYMNNRQYKVQQKCAILSRNLKQVINIKCPIIN